MSSEDYEYGSEDGDVYMSEGDSGDDDDYGFDTSAEVFSVSRKNPYAVLSKPQVIERQKEVVSEVTAILGITDEDATRILRKYKWDSNRVNEEWFTDEAAVQASVGIIDPVPPTTDASTKCMICFETFEVSKMRCAACSHFFCQECWSGYITNAIQNGPTALDLRCPLPDCKAAVPVALVREMMPPVELAKYEAYELRSFVENNRGLCWCPGRSCESAVEVKVERPPDEPLDVLCTGCGSTFCFSCKEEAHRPVSCTTVRKWITKNSAESENLNWILANTKPCPRCHRPIEKNQGCMHMTCSQCRHEFCWLCNGAWSDHGERTGGFYACNRYEAAKVAGSYDDETRRRENAKHSLERYMHYFERFDAHNQARNKALQEAAKTSEEMLEQLSDMTKTPTSQLKFIMDAWGQIVECRRMLKWTYAYGYYAFADESDPGVSQQRHFFEFLQGDAEHSLEKLHELVEKDLKDLKEAHEESRIIPAEAFQDFRKRLIGLTDVTHDFFHKLVQQLEKGFADMDRMYAGEVAPPPEGPSSSSQAGPSGSGAGPSSSNAADPGGTSEGGPAAKRTRAALKQLTEGKGKAAGPGGGAGDDPVTNAALAVQGFWVCEHCTVDNPNLEATECFVCSLPRS